MESGFKRLWRRKKNKEPGDASRTTSLNDFGRTDSITTGGRRSSVTSRPFEKVNETDYLSTPSGGLPKSKSGNRIQPILIGISRPGDFTHRPETAVSLNTAVQRAADTARVSQDRHRNQSASQQGHRRSISGRSVDILKVAGKLTGYKSRYNEEVAVRNIDGAQALDETAATKNLVISPAYVPTSRYQEEVADRNASGLYGSRTSLEYERATSSTGWSARNVSSPVASPQYSSPRNQSQLHSRPSYEQSAYHSRQYSSRSRDGGPMLPAILQERTSEEDQRIGEIEWSKLPVTGLARVYSPTTVNQADLLATKPLPEIPRQSVKSSNSAEIVPQSARQIHSSHGQYDTVESPSTPPPAKHSGRITINDDELRETQVRPVRAVNRSTRSPSMLSSTSAKAAPGSSERKIMDLTVEDVYSETSSTYGYSQYSPVLEQANTGRFEKTSRFNPPSAHGNSVSNEIDPVPELSQESIQHYMSHTPHKRAQQAEASSRPKITFSGINTVASLPPGSDKVAHGESTMAAPTREEVIRQPETQLPSHVDSKSASQQEQQNVKTRRAPPREDSLSRVQRAAAALEARSASQSPKPSLTTNGETVKRRSFVSTNEEPSGTVEKVVSALEPAAVAPSNTPTTTKGSATMNAPQKKTPKITSKTGGDLKPSPSELPQPSQSSQASIKATAIDAGRSVDPTEAADFSGVRTRDFAINPAKSLKSQRKKSDPQFLKRTATENAYKAGSEARSTGAKSELKRPIRSDAKKSTKSQAKRSASAAYVPAKSEFDEEAFAKKQAEAKAALLRLQQSLQEDFITLPDPVPSKRRPRNLEDDSSPVAPSSIVYPQSILSQTVERPLIVRSQTDDTPKAPPPSFRAFVTPSDRAMSASSMYNRSGAGSSRKAAPASLKNVEAAATPIDPAALPPSLQQLLFASSAQHPRSPGEISLSSFPIPSSRPGSEQDNVANMSRPTGYSYLRRNSNRSLASVASQFSIPFQMIPDRSSSYRDAVIEEDD